MNAETVVEAVQTDAAQTAAHHAAAADAAVVTEEIAAVDERLAEHQEISEERHEEILEDTAWLRTSLETIQTTQQSTNQLLAQVQTELMTMRARVDALPVLTPTSPLSLTSEPPKEPEKKETPTTIEPEKVESGKPPAESPAESPAPPTRPGDRRRRMV